MGTAEESNGSATRVCARRENKAHIQESARSGDVRVICFIAGNVRSPVLGTAEVNMCAVESSVIKTSVSWTGNGLCNPC